MKLHEQRDAYADLAARYEGIVRTIEDYLNSEKYMADNMVNKNDILMRIREGRNEIYRECPDLT